MSRRGQNVLRFDDLAAFDRFKRTPHGFVDGVRPLEADIAKGVAEALDKHPRVAFSVRQNSGCGYLIDSKTFSRLVEAGHLRKNEARFMRFGWKGQLDRSGMLIGGRRLDVEIKRPGGFVRPEQIATMDAINRGGGLAFIAESVDDVFREIPL